jgi:hypothetical protein
LKPNGFRGFFLPQNRASVRVRAGDYSPPPFPPPKGEIFSSNQIHINFLFLFSKQRGAIICVLPLNAMKMKGILTAAIIGIFALTGWSQTSTVTNSEVTFFGQCLIEVLDIQEMKTLETEMRNNPYIKVCRLDYNTQRAFILTKSTETLTEEQFTSWFIGYSDKVRCVQVGVHGVDQVKPFPFVDCIK